MNKLIAIAVSALVLVTSCAAPPKEATPATTASEPSSPPAAAPYILSDTDRILERDGAAQYFWRYEEDDCVLYALYDGEASPKKLAVFSALKSDEYITKKRVVDFGICGDWIIASVGFHSGSGSYFHGNFFRMKKDGSELAHFNPTDDDNFAIVEGWIYYNYWRVEALLENDPIGYYRIRPDGTDKEYLGDKIYSFITYAEDGYIYGERDTGARIYFYNDEYSNPITDLIRCDIDGNNAVVLFSGETLPKIDGAEVVEYSQLTIEEKSVVFQVSVDGRKNGENWRRYLYTADYCVNKDGSDLVLLDEEYYE